ncbi:hypothetical protein [Cellulosimicrobium cellulans]|uniref:hypothetical protein n=1 Tax=Cellulosimicrobium cellulans TaxID=1710 RepID=UPI0014832EB2|nr:hypothetical protein [Cellulosimicrobium cellulans]
MAEATLGMGIPAGSGGGPRSSLDRVQRAFTDRGHAVRTVRQNSFMATCPVHDDGTPSLHVTWSRSAHSSSGGAVLLYCHGCQARTEDIVEAIGLTMPDLFDEPLPSGVRGSIRVGKSPQSRRAAGRRGKLGPLPAPITQTATTKPSADHEWVEVERYPYVDHQDLLIQEVIREECTAEGERHKQFRQLFVTREGRRVKRKPAEFYPVLYRAPQVAQAVRDGVEIWLVEGEKDVKTVEERFGLVATTNTQGGRSFPAELAEELRGADVVVPLDRDPTGWARGVDLHTKLTAVDARVRLILPAVDQPKADVTDHADAGLGADDFIDISIAEVVTWHALASAQGDMRAKAKAVHLAVAEALAQKELSESGDPASDADQHRRYATRWTLEAQIRHEALVDLVEKVHTYAARAGATWTGDAVEEADRILTECAQAARRCHRDLDVKMPQLLLEPSAAPADALDAPSTADTSSPSAFPGRPGTSSTSPAFRVLDDRIVQWEPERSSRRERDEDQEDKPGSFKTLLSMVVRVTAREYLEVEEAQDVEHAELLGRAQPARARAASPRALVAVRVRYNEPSGELVEIRVMADQWRDHSWLESLPGPPDYDHKRAGLDTLQRAILAISDDVVDEILHRSTGWRENPDGTHRYIHARGAITASGHLDAPTAFSGALRRYDLPDPVEDREALRQAWLTASATMLDRLPERISAPLLGHVFRAAIGHNPWVLTLVGPPGSYKTSVAAKAMHHFGERWEHSKPASSMSGNGDTFNALRLKLHAAKDALLWMDDFAPTKSWLEAQKHLEETARLIHNQEERERNSRDGQENKAGTPPRASGLFTSEVMPRPGSASERMLVVPLARDDVDTDRLFPLDEPLSRHGRALVMASYISWLAADLTARRAHYAQIADAYADQLVKESGQTVRQANAVASTWAGWVAMSDFLLEAGAIDAEEREQTLRRVHDGMHGACQAAINPDMPRTVGARVRELLAYALRQGIAYVDDVRTGECPPWPLAGRLGWRRTAISEVSDMDPTPARYRLDRGSIRLGYVMHDPGPRERGRVLMCDSTQLEAVLKSASATQAERLEIDRNTATRALHEEGVLIADTSENRVRHTLKCKIYAEGDRYARMVTLHLDKVIGEDLDDVDDEPSGDGGPDDGGAGPQTPPPAGSPNTLEIPGLTIDPHQMDNDQALMHGQEVAVTNHLADTTDGPDQPSEELTMSPQHATAALAPCVECGYPCASVIDGEQIHRSCWREVYGIVDDAPQTPAPAAPAPQTPAPAAPAPAAPAPAAPAPAAPAPAAPRSKAPAASSGDKAFRASAVVLDAGKVWASNGEQYALPPTGPRHLGDVADIGPWAGLGTQITKYMTASGQVWIGDEVARDLGIDVDAIRAAADKDKDKVAHEVTKGIPAVTDALAAGYSLGGRDGDSLGRWTRIWKGNDKAVWLVLLAAMPDDGGLSVPLLQGNPDYARLARRIGLLAGALGHPFQLSGSTTGLDLMKALRRKDQAEFFAPQEPVPPAQQANIEVDLSWSRKPTDEELEHGWIHAYDRSGSYLAGVSGLELGIGTPEHHPEGTAFTPRVPGYWRIEIPDSGDWRMPNPLDPKGRNAGKVRWVTTPALEFAIEQEYDPEILEAYTWAKRARVFDPWYERIRDARAELDVEDEDAQVARDQVKAIYAPTIGMLGSDRHMAGREGYAPERRHMIVAKARTNILRRVARIGQETGRWPVAIVTDTVLYTSPDPDPVASWPGGERWYGRELGRYKHEGSVELAAHLEYLTGDGYKGKDQIVRPRLGSE